jgi:hypothetical protein
MEYIAIRENQRLELINETKPCNANTKEIVGANTPFREVWGGKITPEFVRSKELPEAVPLFQITSTIQKANP